MKQQVVIIHGGETFDTYKDYISSLKNREVSLDKLRSQRDWKDTLAERLGEDFDVLSPRMPNGTNARYKEWEIWFERITPFLGKDLIFIGHSLGGIFLAKYLSENTISKTIKATILVAAPFDDANEESLADFKLSSSLAKFSEQSGVIYLIHSKDDPIVPFEQLKKYKQGLPNSKTIILNNREHFNQEAFPEIIKLIRTL
ncbi:MAG: alpha/beta hydrolase [Patescibacteria group bacterium]